MAQGYVTNQKATIANSKFWGLQVDPVTSKMTMVTIAPGSGTLIRLQDYVAYVFENSDVSFNWDTTYPANLVMTVS